MTKNIEEKEKEIRSDWFENHVAKVTKHDNVTILDWNEPGTSMYAVRYVFTGNSLFVSGDIGEAVFSLTWRSTLESFEDINLHYLMGKLSCSSHERWSFNEKKAEQELNEWYEEIISENDSEDEIINIAGEVKEAIESAISESTMCKHFEHWVWQAYHDIDQDYFDSEDFDMFSSFGQELPYCFIGYLTGIKMAIEQTKVTA